MCSGPAQYRLTPRQYSMLEGAGTCSADLDPGYCFAGRSVLRVHVCSHTIASHCLSGMPKCQATLSLRSRHVQAYEQSCRHPCRAAW